MKHSSSKALMLYFKIFHTFMHILRYYTTISKCYNWLLTKQWQSKITKKLKFLNTFRPLSAWFLQCPLGNIKIWFQFTKVLNVSCIDENININTYRFPTMFRNWILLVFSYITFWHKMFIPLCQSHFYWHHAIDHNTYCL